jgi:hypothetical protein
MNKSSGLATAALGIAILGGLITGLAGMPVTVFAFFNGDWIGAGISLGASALAFGFVANAISRE